MLVCDNFAVKQNKNSVYVFAHKTASNEQLVSSERLFFFFFEGRHFEIGLLWVSLAAWKSFYRPGCVSLLSFEITHLC